ncbi:MAG: hypothetical protein WCR72_04910 [Bacteroidota bacterium]
MIAAAFISASVLLFFLGSLSLRKGAFALAVRGGIMSSTARLTTFALAAAGPSLAISIYAAATGHGPMVIGNIIGGNMFNICIILGIQALFTPFRNTLAVQKTDIFILAAATLLFVFFFSDRQISRIEGGILLLGSAVYAYVKIRLSHSANNTEADEALDQFQGSGISNRFVPAGYVLAGIACLAAGSLLLLNGGLLIASHLGETITGFTILAASTGSPALLVMLAAARKKKYEMAVVNIPFTNILNITGIIGLTALINPLSALAISNIDLYVMAGVPLLLLPFFRKPYTLKRDDGIFMIVIYLVYLYYLLPK